LAGRIERCALRWVVAAWLSGRSDSQFARETAAWQTPVRPCRTPATPAAQARGTSREQLTLARRAAPIPEEPLIARGASGAPV